MSSFADYTKKKKKQSAEGVSFTDYTKSVLGRDDIEAPTYKTYNVSDDDIAPVKTETETDERKWFEKGAFEDGYQFGDVVRTIVSTTTDTAENVYAGVIGMGEKVVDAGAYVVQGSLGTGLKIGKAILKTGLGLGGLSEAATRAIKGEDISLKETGEILRKWTEPGDEYVENVEESAEKGFSDFIAKDLYDEKKVASYLTGRAFKEPVKDFYTGLGMDEDVFEGLYIADDKNSILGDKTESLAQSGGQLLATAGLQAVGVPWWVTTGVTSFGGAVDEAYKEDATYAEAGISAAITAGAEILTEKISGGIKFGGKALGDVVTDGFLRNISNKTVRTLSKLGIDAAGEGFEEILSGVMSAVGQKLTYADEKEFNELFSFEEAWESFIGGVFLGGGFSGADAVQSKAKGVDPTTKLTENEETVVNKVYEDRIKEAEKDGKALTAFKKQKIYDDILEEMEKGYISTDTIEEVLGGETYKTYKNAFDNEEALQNEFNELNKMKQGEMTGEQIDRRAELKEQLADLKAKTNTADMKTKLGEEVFSLVKDSKLAESYNEKSRRGQAFEADLSQYDEKYQGTIKKAVESGILNNTRRTHEFVDFVAKISADKGVLFDFTDNEKLKNSSYAVDGKTVNGFVDDSGNVVLNINSAKSLNSTAGHEITHILEGTELYQPFAEYITEYAKTKGEYDSRLAALNKLYEGVYKGEDFDTKVQKELVADLVGDYIFTDKDFVRKLSTENRNVFQKIYDEVKYLCKVATAGSKEARELEKVKKVFAEVYRESGQVNQSGKSQSKVAETTEETGTKTVDETTDKPTKKGYSGEDGYNYFDSLDEETSNLHNTISINGITIDLQNASQGLGGKHLVSSQTVKDGKVVPWGTNELFDSFEEAKTYAAMLSFEAESYDGGITPMEKFWGKTESDTKYSLSTDSEGKQLSKEQQDFFKDSKMLDENGNLKVMYHGSEYAGFHEFNSKFSDDDTSFFFVDRNEVAQTYSGSSEVYTARSFNTVEEFNQFFEEIEAEEYEVIKQGDKYALLENNEVEITSPTLKELYDEFCDYTGLGQGSANYKVYLNLKNPLIVDANGRNWNRISGEFSQEIYDRYKSLTEEEKTALVQLASWEDASIFRDELETAVESVERKANYVDDYIRNLANAAEKLGDADKYRLFDIATDNFSEESLRENAVKYLNTREYSQRAKEQGYDGVIFKNIVDNGGFADGKEGASTVAIAFESNQIKSVANDKPTGNPDIRYSLSERKTVDASTQKIIERLNNGEDISIEEINSTPTISHLLNDAFSRPETYTINTPERNTKRKEVADKLLALGSAKVDNEGKAWYNGSVKQERRADIVIGLSAAGKSSVLVVPLSEFYSSRIIDSDMAKEELDEFDNGLGANAVHRESQDIITNVLARSINNGDNIVYPIVGGNDVNSLINKINSLKNRGYSVYLHLNELPNSKAIGRSLNRYIEKGRFIPPEIIKQYGDTPTQNFNTIISIGGLVDGYSHYSNDVNRDEKPKLIEVSDNVRQFDERGRSVSKFGQGNRASQKTGNETDNQIAPIKETSSTDGVFFDGKKPQYSLSEADNTYLSAVEKGDTETAQMLVDEAADNSGYTIKAYHGTPNTEFTVFDKARLGKGNDQYGAGFYFASDKTGASYYGNRVINAALDIKNPIRITATGESGRNLIDADVELTSEQAYEVVKRHPDMYDEENSPLGDFFDSYWESGAEDWMIESLAEQYRDVGYLDSDLFRNYPNELHEALRDVVGYDGVEVTFENTGEKFYVAWFDNQMKSVEPITYDNDGKVIPLSERFNKDNNDIRYSLSEQDEAPTKYGNFNIYGKDVKLEKPTEDIAPVMDSPVTEEEALAQAREDFASIDDADAPPEVEAPYTEYSDTTRLDNETLKNISKSLKDVLYLNRREAQVIKDVVQKYSTSEMPDKAELFWEIKEQFGERTYDEPIQEVEEIRDFLRGYKIKISDNIKGDIPDFNSFRRSLFNKVNIRKDGIPVDVAYMELREMFPSFFPGDLINSTDQFMRIAEVANMKKTNDIPYYLGDETIQEAVDIITDEVSKYKENTARIEAEDMARESLGDIAPVRADQVVNRVKSQDNAPRERIDTVEYRQSKKLQALEQELADNKQLLSESVSDYQNRIARLVEEYESLTDFNSRKANDIIRKVARLERLKTNVEADYSKRISGLETRIEEAKQNVKTDRVADVLTEEPTVEKKKSGVWQKFKGSFLDKGAVFEDLSLKKKNRNLQAKYNFLHYSEGIAQRLIGKGTNGVKALNDIRAEVEKTGKTEDFYKYLYHKHNIDRMNLEDRYEDVENKPVFGDFVTSEVSQGIVNKIEAENPDFKAYADDVYTYMNYLRNQLVEKGVISQETADLWAEMYPHYVPIRRVGDNGVNINVALDTNKTGVNAPVKRATGGNSDILPLFDTMAMRTLQTFKAAAKNNFGVELKNTLGTTIEKAPTDIDGIIDSVDSHESLLHEGKNGQAPTFTVFENGERVTFEITEEMYDALKPTSKGLAYTNKVANTISNLHRNVLTQFNPTFMLTNAVKDAQDVLMNSQHPAKTYANFPQAVVEMISGKGQYYAEYIANGGEQNTYFEKDSNTFAKEKGTLRKIVGFPLDAISKANDFIEKIPRVAEYIASRKNGASVEVSMLDAARVTTNFAAGGDVTKFLNRNGATFLNASVQGAMQQVRNIREAKANGLKGWVGLAAKTAIAGLPAILLNGLLWDDDEEYAELSDYVKDNYYIVAKTEDGKFIRIPKGRAVAVIQEAFEQIGNAITGDDEVDFANFFELVMNNIAPNNPIENNILAPIMQVANNKAWYGGDLVPTRLQDLPEAEQFDESTDELSKWLGEKLNFSPYKINYLLNQYSGGLGDVILPMLTPEAESGDNSIEGNLLAPLKDKFTTDSVMNNQNVSDFYDKVDELTKNANSSKATDEDILKQKYMNSINADLGELYQQKREIQNSSLPDDVKYERVRNIQEQINSLARESLNTYENVRIQGKYATVGNTHYRWYEPGEESSAEAGWQKISGKQLEKQEEVTNGLGISASEYWSNKEEYDYAYEYPENYAVAKAVGGYKAYKTYTSELYDIKADKDENGKSISGSRKEKVADYINNLDIDYYEKIILFKNEYNADDTYNYEIIDYLNGREDISYAEMEAILKKLGFTVTSDGTIRW